MQDMEDEKLTINFYNLLNNINSIFFLTWVLQSWEWLT